MGTGEPRAKPAPGKAGKAAAPEAAAAAAPASGSKKEKAPPRPDGDKAAAGSGGRFGHLRLRPAVQRPIFFLVFLVGCGWILAMYEPCDVKGKKRDCGYSGISPMECRLTACLLKGGGGVAKKVVKVKRTEGAALGLKLEEYEKEPGLMVVTEVTEGAVQEHNRQLPAGSEDGIYPGDRIAKLDGVAAKPGAPLSKALAKTTGSKVVDLEVQRSKLPHWLDWLRSVKGKPNLLERLLTSSGAAHFARSWFFLARIALGLWYASGYPPHSLPFYFGVSALVAGQTTRCCHDEAVSPGVPHCYRGRREPMLAVVQRVSTQSAELWLRVAKDPKGYAQWLFGPQTS